MLVLGIQLIPVSQVGSLLFSNQITEEKCSGEDGNFGSFVKKTDFAELFTLNAASCQVVGPEANMHDRGYFHYAETLPPSHPGDIHSPPPNA